MQFNSVRTGNYAQAASAVTKNTESIYDTSRATSADFTKIAKEVLKGRSNERQVAEVAKGKAEIQKMKGEQLVEMEKMKRDLEKDVRGIKRPAQRMAGITAALGSMTEAYAYGVERKERQADAARAEARAIESEKRMMEMLKPQKTKSATELMGGEERPTMIKRDADGNIIPQVPATGPTDPGSTQPTATGVSTATAPTNTKGQTVPSNTKGSVSRQDVFTYLTKEKGLPKNNALGLMANIDRESGFRPSIASGDDGGPGGLFQWKGVRQTGTVQGLVKKGDWKGQIDYALTEPQNLSMVEPGKFQSLTFQTPQAAADWWMNKWERPADRDGGSKKHTSFLSGYNFQ